MQNTDVIKPKGSGAPADTFTAVPLYIALIVWAVCAIPVIYDIGGLFIDPSMVPGLLVLPPTAVVWLISIVWAAFRLRWRRALSIGGATVAFLGLAFLSALYRHEIRFETMRPLYAIEVGRQASAKGEAKTSLSWMWAGGYDFQETLFYDESDKYAPPPGEAEYINDKCPIGISCSTHIRAMGGHFYLSIQHW